MELKEKINNVIKLSKDLAEDLRKYKDGKHTDLSLRLDSIENYAEIFIKANNL